MTNDMALAAQYLISLQKILNAMGSAIYTLTILPRERHSEAPNESKTDRNIQHIGESADNRQPVRATFKGGGILIRPIPFYVRNNQPNLQEFEIF